MNRSLLSSVHGAVSGLVVAALCVAPVLLGQSIGRAPQGSRGFLLWSGWIALAFFLAAYAYVLRKYAHKLGYSPEFARQVPRTAMEVAEQRLGALRDRIAARTLTDRAQILQQARAVLQETGCQRVLRVALATDAAGGTLLVSKRTEPLGRTARWMHAHVYYGLGAGVLTLVHGGGRFESPMGIALNGLTLIVVVTGVIGLFCWMWGPAWLSRKERDLSIEEAFVLARHYSRRLHEEVQKLSDADVGVTAGLTARAAPPSGLAAQLARALGGGPEADRRAQDLLTLSGQRRRVKSELARLQRAKFAMNAWRLVHIPASIVLLGVIAAHVVSIWLY